LDSKHLLVGFFFHMCYLVCLRFFHLFFLIDKSVQVGLPHSIRPNPVIPSFLPTFLPSFSFSPLATFQHVLPVPIQVEQIPPVTSLSLTSSEKSIPLFNKSTRTFEQKFVGHRKPKNKDQQSHPVFGGFLTEDSLFFVSYGNDHSHKVWSFPNGKVPYFFSSFRTSF